MKKLITLFFLLLMISGNLSAQSTEGFASVTKLNPVPIHTNLGDQPQSKVWTHDGKWWAVMPETNTGTFIWKLDGTTWNKALQIFPGDFTKADVKVVGDVAHILLFRGDNLASYLVSVEYDQANNTYKLWSLRPDRQSIDLGTGVSTATIDIDSQNRMWLAYDATSTINVRWSDAPYTTWSEPITLATGVTNEDISAVIALPALNKVGVMWSDQTTRRYGFRTHTDGEDPSNWSANEVPASQSALESGRGMANNHLNLAVASDGTLYAAIKTRYSIGQTQVALLVRRPTGTWDDLYPVATTEGNRPIVILNENIGKLKVIYAAPNAGGIFYKESPTSNISFGNELSLITESSDYATSIKGNYTQDVVIFGSTNNQAFSVLATDNTTVTSVEDDKGVGRNLSAYPNPFESKATISFRLPENGAYSIVLYDLKGSRISTLKESRGAAGEQKVVTIDGSLLPAGLYLVRLETAGKTNTLKLVLQR